MFDPSDIAATHVGRRVEQVSTGGHTSLSAKSSTSLFGVAPQLLRSNHSASLSDSGVSYNYGIVLLSQDAEHSGQD